MTLIEYLLLIIAFVLASFGLGLPIACRWLKDPVEILCGAPVVGLTLCFVLTFGLFMSQVRLEWFAIAPICGAVGLWFGKNTWMTIWGNAQARATVLGWLIVAAWVQFLALTLVSFSGGAWGGDWLEHHQRALFFREPVPLRLGGYLPPVSANHHSN